MEADTKVQSEQNHNLSAVASSAWSPAKVIRRSSTSILEASVSKKQLIKADRKDSRLSYESKSFSNSQAQLSLERAVSSITKTISLLDSAVRRKEKLLQNHDESKDPPITPGSTDKELSPAPPEHIDPAGKGGLGVATFDKRSSLLMLQYTPSVQVPTTNQISLKSLVSRENENHGTNNNTTKSKEPGEGKVQKKKDGNNTHHGVARKKIRSTANVMSREKAASLMKVQEILAKALKSPSTNANLTAAYRNDRDGNHSGSRGSRHDLNNSLRRTTSITKLSHTRRRPRTSQSSVPTKRAVENEEGLISLESTSNVGKLHRSSLNIRHNHVESNKQSKPGSSPQRRVSSMKTILASPSNLSSGFATPNAKPSHLIHQHLLSLADASRSFHYRSPRRNASVASHILSRNKSSTRSKILKTSDTLNFIHIHNLIKENTLMRTNVLSQPKNKRSVDKPAQSRNYYHVSSRRSIPSNKNFLQSIESGMAASKAKLTSSFLLQQARNSADRSYLNNRSTKSLVPAAKSRTLSSKKHSMAIVKNLPSAATIATKRSSAGSRKKSSPSKGSKASKGSPTSSKSNANASGASSNKNNTQSSPQKKSSPSTSLKKSTTSTKSNSLNKKKAPPPKKYSPPPGELVLEPKVSRLPVQRVNTNSGILAGEKSERSSTPVGSKISPSTSLAGTSSKPSATAAPAPPTLKNLEADSNLLLAWKRKSAKLRKSLSASTKRQRNSVRKRPSSQTGEQNPPGEMTEGKETKSVQDQFFEKLSGIHVPFINPVALHSAFTPWSALKLKRSLFVIDRSRSKSNKKVTVIQEPQSDTISVNTEDVSFELPKDSSAAITDTNTSDSNSSLKTFMDTMSIESPSVTRGAIITKQTFQKLEWETRWNSMTFHDCVYSLSQTKIQSSTESLTVLKFSRLTAFMTIFTLLSKCPNLERITFANALVVQKKVFNILGNGWNWPVIRLPNLRILEILEWHSPITKYEYWLLDFFVKGVVSENLETFKFEGPDYFTLSLKNNCKVDPSTVAKFLIKNHNTLRELSVGGVGFQLMDRPLLLSYTLDLQLIQVTKLRITMYSQGFKSLLLHQKRLQSLIITGFVSAIEQEDLLTIYDCIQRNQNTLRTFGIYPCVVSQMFKIHFWKVYHFDCGVFTECKALSNLYVNITLINDISNRRWSCGRIANIHLLPTTLSAIELHHHTDFSPREMHALATKFPKFSHLTTIVLSSSKNHPFFIQLNWIQALGGLNKFRQGDFYNAKLKDYASILNYVLAKPPGTFSFNTLDDRVSILKTHNKILNPQISL